METATHIGVMERQPAEGIGREPVFRMTKVDAAEKWMEYVKPDNRSAMQPAIDTIPSWEYFLNELEFE